MMVINMHISDMFGMMNSSIADVYFNRFGLHDGTHIHKTPKLISHAPLLSEGIHQIMYLMVSQCSHIGYAAMNHSRHMVYSIVIHIAQP